MRFDAIVIFSIILLSSVGIFARNANKVLIQINGKYLDLHQVAEMRGFRVAKNNNKLFLKSKKQSYLVDSKIFMELFPDNIKLTLKFKSTFPLAKIYLDDNDIDVKTDKNGNAYSRPIYPEPGLHYLKILKNAKHKNFKFTLSKDSEILCSGKLKFQCSFKKLINS